MKKLFALLCITIISFNNYSQECKNITFEWGLSKDFDSAERVYVESFSEAYKEIPLELLKVKSVESFLKEVFAGELADLHSGDKNVYCVVAKCDDRIIGFMTFETTEKADEVYIRQLAVDPSVWGYGIGKKLVFSIIEQLPTTKKLLLVTRKVNSGARNFYKKIGFYESEYIHEGLSPERYVGLEIAL